MSLDCSSNLNEGREKPLSFIYPNPTSDRLFIEGNVDLNQAIDIFDARGRICFSVDYTKAGIDLNALSSGLYLIRYYDKIQGRQESRQLLISN